MAVLIQHGEGENAVYTRLDPSKPISVSHSFDYHRNDEVFEKNRKKENQPVLRDIVSALKSIKHQASRGFGSKNLSTQLRIIGGSKTSISPILSEGSFYIKERQRILEITDRMIDRYYKPYINKNTNTDSPY